MAISESKVAHSRTYAARIQDLRDYASEAFPDHRFPRVQILTIEDLLSGDQPQYPRYAPAATFQRAPRRRRQGRLG